MCSCMWCVNSLFSCWPVPDVVVQFVLESEAAVLNYLVAKSYGLSYDIFVLKTVLMTNG